jgi:hypothetical protein
MKTTTTPLPEKIFDLYYRGKPILTGDTKGNCNGVINDKMRTGCYIRSNFEIKPTK